MSKIKTALGQTDADVIMLEIESRDAAQMFDLDSLELLNEINRKYKQFPLWIFGVALTALLSTTAYLPLGLLSVIVLFWLDRRRRMTAITYVLDQSTTSKLETLYQSFNEIMKAEKTWHISASGQVRERKYHAGASKLLSRSLITITYRAPKFIKTNVKVPRIPVGKQSLYFFPDRILVEERRKIGFVRYEDLTVESANGRFVEEGALPRDAVVVDQTWKYVNANGEPDRRFKDNRQLPVVLYSELRLSSKSGLNELIQVSRSDVVLPQIEAE